jgi:hypothetical protein
MTAKTDFADRIKRIEEVSRAPARVRTRLHTPVPGVVDDGAIAKPRFYLRQQASGKGGALSFFGGLFLGLSVLSCGAVVLTEDLDAFAPEGVSISALVAGSPLLSGIRHNGRTLLSLGTQIADTQTAGDQEPKPEL